MWQPARLAALGAVVLAAAGCGGGAAAEVRSGPPELPVESWTGSVTYEARSATPTGASERLEVRPARHVVVEARDVEGRTLGRTVTDAEGVFRLEAPVSATEVVVRARVRVDGHDVAVSRDSGGAIDHTLRQPLDRPGSHVEMRAAEDDPDGAAGAFHIVDTMYRGVAAVRRWTGETLPPVFAYWGRGVTRTWSYYRGERPAGSGRYCVELLGGEPGRQATTDTDEHDEAIVLHELGHFVMDRLSSDSSPGGNHPAGYLVDPGLAWEEGRATWFATAVLGAPQYWDTIGVEPTGRLRVSHDLERGVEGPRGMGSEQGVSEILWRIKQPVCCALTDGRHRMEGRTRRARIPREEGGHAHRTDRAATADARRGRGIPAPGGRPEDTACLCPDP